MEWAGMHLMEEITRLVNMPVYTREGTFIGNVKNVVLDISTRKLESLVLGRSNPAIVEHGADVAVPYRWVNTFDDIVVLNFFPRKVKGPKLEEKPAPDSEISQIA